MARIAFIVIVFLCGSSIIAQDDMFGLGEATPTAAAGDQSEETFGLSGYANASKPKPAEAIAPSRAASPNPKAKATAAKPYVSSRTQIIRRSSDAWIDPDIGRWTESKLRSHLKGELGVSGHEGLIPAGQLDDRTLEELKAIHANLHEGWTWDGAVKRARATTRESITFSETNCPGGVCPPPQRSFRFLRRFR